MDNKDSANHQNDDNDDLYNDWFLIDDNDVLSNDWCLSEDDKQFQCTLNHPTEVVLDDNKEKVSYPLVTLDSTFTNQFNPLLKLTNEELIIKQMEYKKWIPNLNFLLNKKKYITIYHD